MHVSVVCVFFFEKREQELYDVSTFLVYMRV